MSGEVSCRLGDPLLAVDRGDHVVAPGLQAETERAQQRGVVVDHQHFRH